MIDRPIRPLFPKGWHFETQLVAIPLSIDHVHPYDILAMNGASAALMISDVPLPDPVGAVRIGKIDGNFVVNPDEEALLEDTDLDLIVAGTEEAILMVEAGANEIPEAEILDALDIAHDAIKKLCAAQRELAEKVGKPKLEVEAPQIDEGLLERDPRQPRRRRSTRRPRSSTSSSARTRPRPSRRPSLEQYAGDPERRHVRRVPPDAAARRSTKLEKPIIRERIAVTRSAPTAAARRRSARSRSRPASPRARTARRCSPAARPRPFSVAALGTLKEEMRLDTLGLETKKYYWHHYNFPPFSVGRGGLHARPQAA